MIATSPKLEPLPPTEVTAATVAAPVSTEPEQGRALAGAALRGVVWVSAVRWAAQLFTWASTLVLARLLAPEDYGLVAMATVLTGFLEVVTDMGLGSALVQQRDLRKRDVEATMGATVMLGLGASILVALSAPLWARLQGDARLTPIVWALSFGVLLTVVSTVPFSMLNRRLAFGFVARAQFVRGLVTAFVTLGSALVLQSHWALVVGYLAAKVAFTGMLCWAEPTRPRFPGGGTHVGQLLRFGGVLTADRILNYARSKIDVFLLGMLMGTRMVGLYVMSVALARLPLEKLGSAFEPVAYPTFARQRDNLSELRRTFLGFSLGTMAIALPASLGMIITADLLVPVIIGDKWLPVVVPLQVAALVTPLAFHLGLVNALFNAMGRVDINLKLTTWMSVLTIAAVFVGVRFGIVGVAIATGLAFTIVWVYGEAQALRMIQLPVRDALLALLPTISASLGMTACVWAASRALPASWPGAARLGIEICVGVAAFAAWAVMFHGYTVVRQLRALKVAWRSR